MLNNAYRKKVISEKYFITRKRINVLNNAYRKIQWEQQFNASAYNRNEFSGNEALGTGGNYNL